jgi:hypothetical protein
LTSAGHRLFSPLNDPEVTIPPLNPLTASERRPELLPQVAVAVAVAADGR